MCTVSASTHMHTLDYFVVRISLLGMNTVNTVVDCEYLLLSAAVVRVCSLVQLFSGCVDWCSCCQGVLQLLSGCVD